MKKAASIFLRADLFPDDIQNLCRWMRNGHVTRYLNEDSSAPEQMENMLRTTPAPLLGLHFNKHGRFFLVCGAENESIGFVRLRRQTAECYELVVAIGEERLWGNGYGTLAVRAAQSRAFLEWRAERMIAKIYHENLRSMRTLCGCGFREERRMEGLSQYGITAEEYLHLKTRGKLA